MMGGNPCVRARTAARVRRWRKAIREHSRRLGEFSQRCSGVGGNLALQALPELRVAVMLETADGRDRSAKVPCCEGVGYIVLGCCFPCHRRGLLAPVLSQPVGDIEGHFVKTAIINYYFRVL